MPDFVSPIIETIFKQQQAVQDQQKFQELQRQAKAQEAMDAHKQAQLEKNHADELKLHQAEADANKAHIDAEDKQRVFENISRLVAAGGTPPPGFQVDAKGNPTGNPRLDTNSFGMNGYSFAKSLFPTADEIATSAGKKEGAVQNALYNAQLPAKLAEQQQRASDAQILADQNNRAKLQADAQHAAEVAANAEANRKSQELIHQGQQETQKFLGQLAASVRIQTAHINGGLDEDAIKSYVDSTFLTGDGKEAPAKIAPAIRAAKPDWTPLKKDDAAIIKSIPLVDELLKGVKELNDTTSSYTGTGAAMLGIGDAGNAKRQVLGTLGNIANVFDARKGLFTQNEVERVTKMIFSPADSNKNKRDNIKNLQDFFDSKLAPILSQYPVDQRSAILSTHGIDPSRYSDIKQSTPVKATDTKITLPAKNDPKLINYAKEHFGGDIDKALAAIAEQKKRK